MSGVALGRSAIALPWLCPAADTLFALTDVTPDAVRLSADIGLCAHIARFPRPSVTPTGNPFATPQLLQPRLANSLATLLEAAAARDALFLAVHPPRLHDLIERAVRLCDSVARASPGVCPSVARMTTRLAFLGWSALCAVDPAAVEACLAHPDHRLDARETQRRAFGFDVPVITRRLVSRWRFPDWLAATLTSLHLPATDAARLGAPVELFRVVQSSLAVIEQSSTTLGLTCADSLGDRRTKEMCQLAAQHVPTSAVPSATPAAEMPRPVGLFVRLLRTTALARSTQSSAALAEAEGRVDQLAELLGELRRDYDHELRDAKLAGLAEFAAGAGHEINNPLAIISGNAQLILGKEQDPARQKSLTTIIRQTKRIHDILQGTRNFARPPRPSPETVALDVWLPPVVAGLHSETQAKGVALKLELPPPERSPTVVVDPVQLRQALTHLVRNAVEAAPPESGWIRVGFEVYPRTVRLFVDDNGPGPCAEHLVHLFDPFFSGRSAGRGQGIGLSIAWRLAQLNGGDLRYAPRPDGTTRFTLTLPLASAEVGPVQFRKSA